MAGGSVLVLVRHAKAEPADAGDGVREGTDDDAARALTADGREQALATGTWVRDRITGRLGADAHVDLVLVSSAARTRETWGLVSAAVGAGEVREEEWLFTASAQELVTALAQLGDLAEAAGAGDAGASPGSVLVVGHEPVMSQTVQALTGRSVGFAPSGAVVLQVPRWSDLAAGTATVLETHQP